MGRIGKTIKKKFRDSTGKLKSYKVTKLARGKYKKTLIRPKPKVKKRRR